MGYLFRQVWFLCLLSFLIGSVLTWLVMRMMRRPTVEITEERLTGPAMTGRTSTGMTARESAGAAAAGGAMGAAAARTGDMTAAARPATASTAMPSGTTAAATGAAGAAGAAAGAAASRMGSSSGSDMPTPEAQGSSWTRSPDTTGKAAMAGATKRMVEPGPYPGSARSAVDGSAPTPEYMVKGNAQSMLYHTKDSPSFQETKAEFWFKTTAEAERAGFASWTTRTRSKNT